MAVFQMLTLPLFATSLMPFAGLAASACIGLIAFLTLPVIAVPVQVSFKLVHPGLVLQSLFGIVTGSMAVYLAHLFDPTIFVKNLSTTPVITFSVSVTSLIFLISFASRFMDVRKTVLWPKR